MEGSKKRKYMLIFDFKEISSKQKDDINIYMHVYMNKILSINILCEYMTLKINKSHNSAEYKKL